jgi:hypothetical protein
MKTRNDRNMWPGGRGLLVLLLLAVTALVGCSEDTVDAEPSIGQVERSETVTATGLALVTNGEGVARLVGTLLNEGETTDRLSGVDVDTEIGQFAVTIAEAPVVLRHDEPFRLAREGHVLVRSPNLRQGFRVEMTLVFRNSVPITTTVPVEPRTGPYEDVEVRTPPDGDIAPDR